MAMCLCVYVSQVLLVDVCRCHVLKLSSQPLMQAAVAGAMKPKNKFNFSHLEAVHSNHCATRFMKHSWSTIYSAGKISTARLSEKSLAVVELTLECHPSPQVVRDRWGTGWRGAITSIEKWQVLSLRVFNWCFKKYKCRELDLQSRRLKETRKTKSWKCNEMQDVAGWTLHLHPGLSLKITNCDVMRRRDRDRCCQGSHLVWAARWKAHELLQDGCLWMDADQSSIYGNLCSARSYATSYPTSGTANPVHPERLPFHVITASSCRLTWWFMMNIWISGFQVWASWLIWRIQAVSSSFKQL